LRTSKFIRLLLCEFRDPLLVCFFFVVFFFVVFFFVVFVIFVVPFKARDSLRGS